MEGRTVIIETDALIIGAGASGGVVARELARAGVDVVCLEQGDWTNRAIAWETLTAVTLLEAGADILVMRHPESIRRVQQTIDNLMKVPTLA